MTDKQNKIFVELMSLGHSMGVEHVFECYANWEMHFMNMLPPDERVEHQNKILDTIIEFWKLTASCPEEEEECKSLDRDKMINIINKWYSRPRND